MLKEKASYVHSEWKKRQWAKHKLPREIQLYRCTNYKKKPRLQNKSYTLNLSLSRPQIAFWIEDFEKKGNPRLCFINSINLIWK